MSSPIGFRNGQAPQSHRDSMAPTSRVTTPPARGADYAYRIAALTTGLILLATVM